MPGRNSLESEALLEPHRIYAFDIDLVATANVFAAGHRIRLDVSSSNFPRIAPNPNTGERVNLHTHTCVARNLVYHDSVHASYILLPAVAVH